MRYAICTLLLLLLVPRGNAQSITYVDAQLGGNTINVATGSSTDWGSSANIGTDNLWAHRTSGPGVPCAGGDAWQATTGEDAPLLQTTIGGLNPGQQYGVYLYFAAKLHGSPPRSNWWGIRAGLSPARLYDIVDDDISGVPVDPSGNVTSVGLGADYRCRIHIGFASADASGEIPVYIDDNTLAWNPRPSDRVVYDGVGAGPLDSSAPVYYLAGCAGGSGTVPLVTANSAPTLGNAGFGLSVSGAAPSSAGVLLLWPTMTPLTISSCLVELPLVGNISVAFGTGATGGASLALPLPATPYLLGSASHSQTIVLDPQGALLNLASLSHTLTIFIGS